MTLMAIDFLRLLRCSAIVYTTQASTQIALHHSLALLDGNNLFSLGMKSLEFDNIDRKCI